MDKLPVEILELIFKELDSESVLHCRLACRAWKEEIDRMLPKLVNGSFIYQHWQHTLDRSRVNIMALSFDAFG
jgi:hypothetical protein